MNYETITLEQLGNRAHTAYQRGCCGIAATPDTFFAVFYWAKVKNAWWNGFESIELEKAEAEKARWLLLTPHAEIRILQVVANPVAAVEEQPQETETVEEQVVQTVVPAAYQARKGDPTDDWDANCAQSHATRMDTYRPRTGSWMWAVLVVGNTTHGGRLSTKDIIPFSSLADAKAGVAQHVGKCAQATVFGRTRHEGEYGEWLSYRGDVGCSYDRSEVRRHAFEAGVWDAAYEKDWLNEEAAREDARRACIA